MDPLGGAVFPFVGAAAMGPFPPIGRFRNQVPGSESHMHHDEIYEGIGVEFTQIMTDLAVKTSRRH